MRVFDWKVLVSQQVNCWLMSVELEEYSDVFTKNNIDGNELLTLDSARIKVCQVLAHVRNVQKTITECNLHLLLGYWCTTKTSKSLEEETEGIKK